ncbi:MAG: pseudouridine-5'-phosphate glycosidase [Saprospiraceae bacterium]|jgi:pseudouridine-5'-phosphate glycosidase|nr:pseudouridine-5'-phosphate glycosidase [Saprospiraceae bacterium]
MKQLNPFLEISPSVNEALQNGQPVVALESTIISHGMPYPDNVQTALLVERTVRENGALPATIAIIGGKLKVGLSESEIEFLGKAGREAAKVSRRDAPFLLSSGRPGATTVASTMIIAEMAGIHIFATGGIGGVHRGAAETMDISADLQELARTSVAVVCAGAKSILDLGLTLEYLETHGVPVIGYQTDEFPAFYTRHSGHGVDYRLDSPGEIAKVLKIKWLAGLAGGVVIANPIPEAHEPMAAPIQAATEAALAEALRHGIRGKESTPFLLGKIKELTGGESLRANIELVLNNARLAAKLAVELCAADQF